MMTLAETANFMKSNNDYLILTHRRPDGDTLGSAAGLCLGLQSLGKRAYVAANPEAAGHFERFVKDLVSPPEFTALNIISVDTASKELFPKEFGGMVENVALAIDHHPNGGAYAARTLLNSTCAATGELVTLLLKEMGVDITPDIARPLYVAIVTDTGCLRYENTTSQTLRVTADLKDTGVNTAAINMEYFEKKTFSRLALEAALLQDVELLQEGRIAIMRLTFEKIEKTQASPDDTDNLASLAREIMGVEIGVTLREELDGETKISLRTGHAYDAGKICARLGGGGHARAAGCTVKLNADKAREAILNAIFDEYELATWHLH